jgi:thiol-disulfide isomerase/thioredoxin
MKKILLAILIITAASLSAQQFYKPDRYVENQRRGIAPCPTFQLSDTGRSVFATKRKPKITIPQNSNGSFAFLSGDPATESYPLDSKILIYLENPGTDSMRCYSDANRNFNFTDDGPAIQPSTNGKITVSIKTPENTLRVFDLEPLKKFMKPDSFLLDIFSSGSYYKGVVFNHPSMWLKCEFRNIKAKNLIIGRDSLCIAFADQNANGLFMDSADVFIAVTYGADSAYTTKLRGAKNAWSGTVFNFGSKTWEITLKDETFSLKERTDTILPIQLTEGSRVPDFILHLAQGDSVSFYEAVDSTKYCFIDFWGVWCGGCRLQIPELIKLNDSLGDRVVIVSVDAYDKQEKLLKFIAEHNMTWTQAVMNDEIRDMFMAGDGFPYGILIAPGRRVLKMDADVHDVYHSIR